MTTQRKSMVQQRLHDAAMQLSQFNMTCLQSATQSASACQCVCTVMWSLQGAFWAYCASQPSTVTQQRTLARPLDPIRFKLDSTFFGLF